MRNEQCLLPLVTGQFLLALFQVHIPEVFKDCRRIGSQFERLEDVFLRRIQLTEFEIGPSQAVEEGGILGRRRHCPLNHLESLGKALILLDQEVAKVVEHHRIVGLQSQSLTKLPFRVAQFVRSPLELGNRNANAIIARRNLRRLFQRGVGLFPRFLLQQQVRQLEIAEHHIGIQVDQLLQSGLRLLQPVQPHQGVSHH